MKRKTKVIKTSKGISELYPLEIEGYKEWLLVRGEDKNNEVLLFLHGGPGTSNIAVARKTQNMLEKHFVVVNWDQLGSGLSYDCNIKPEAMTIDKMIDYTHEIVLHLLTKFNKQKVFLVGHSWGSMLGILFVNKYPELVSRYVGVSQMVDGKENELLAYQYDLDSARKMHNQKAIKELEEIGKPPYSNWMKGLQVRSKWSGKLKGMAVNTNVTGFYMKNMLFSKEYKFSDIFKYIEGFTLSLKNLWPEIMEYDIRKIVKNIPVKCTFFLGNHDYQAPFPIAVNFISNLEATEKDIVWFSNSAHMCLIEENEKFQNEIISLLSK